MEITQKIETGNREAFAQKQQGFLSYFGRSETKPALIKRLLCTITNRKKEHIVASFFFYHDTLMF